MQMTSARKKNNFTVNVPMQQKIYIKIVFRLSALSGNDILHFKAIFRIIYPAEIHTPKCWRGTLPFSEIKYLK